MRRATPVARRRGVRHLARATPGGGVRRRPARSRDPRSDGQGPPPPSVQPERRQGALDDPVDGETAPSGHGGECLFDLLSHGPVANASEHAREGSHGAVVVERPEQGGAGIREGRVPSLVVTLAGHPKPDPDVTQERSRRVGKERRDEPKGGAREPLVGRAHGDESRSSRRQWRIEKSVETAEQRFGEGRSGSRVIVDGPDQRPAAVDPASGRWHRRRWAAAGPMRAPDLHPSRRGTA